MPRLTSLTIAVLALLATRAGSEEPPALKTDKDKTSYGAGVGVARNFKRQGIAVDLDLFVKGMKDAIAGQKLLMSEDELRATMTAFETDLRRKHEEVRKKAAGENQKAGDAFLAENKKKEGVVTLPSGLQYKVLRAGSGNKPTDTDMVVCNYRGTLLDGTEFDSSYRTGKPATFKVKGSLIPGWTEALKLMPVGSKWQVFVPSQLAYGPRGAGFFVGPNATLIFEVDLLAIQ